MPSSLTSPPTTGGPSAGVLPDAPARWARRARRSVGRHRRLLAAVLTAACVYAALGALAPPPPGPQVPVAARNLPAGAELSEADIDYVAWPASVVPSGLSEHPIGETLATPLNLGEPITTHRLRAAGPGAAYPDLVALPVRIPDADVVALLRVGDVIDLIGVDPESAQAETIAQAVPVLTIPEPNSSALTGGATASRDGRLIVVGVPESGVESLASHTAREFISVAFTH